jgi:hypothetical protein
MSVAVDTTWRRDLGARVETLSGALAAGALAGALIGGVGGRLAMLVLRLTSDPSLHGLETDDGFVIGIVSTSTLFLIAVTTVLGTIGGLAYLGFREWLPARSRPWLTGAIAGVIGGAAVIRPGGIDFTKLEPLGLAVVMFVALPAAYGVAVSLMVERSLAARTGAAGRRSWIVGSLLILPFALLGSVGMLAVAALIAGLLWPRSPRATAIWRSAAVTWIGRAALCALVGWFAIELVSDVAEVL